MSGSLFKPAIRRSEISLPGDVTLMSPWRWNSSRCRLQNMRIAVTLTFERCLTTCTIHPNLFDVDDIAHSAHVSLGTPKTVFCCSIVSAIWASCALPMIDCKFWMSGGSDHLTLHVYHVCVSVHMLEQRSVGKGVQRVWLVLDTTWPWTRKTKYPRASWSVCDHYCRYFPFPHILQTCSISHSTVLFFWKITVYLSVCASYARKVPAWSCSDFSMYITPPHRSSSVSPVRMT